MIKGLNLTILTLLSNMDAHVIPSYSRYHKRLTRDTTNVLLAISQTSYSRYHKRLTRHITNVLLANAGIHCAVYKYLNEQKIMNS
jgi:PHP family Zn ribbon phosphoesterase